MWPFINALAYMGPIVPSFVPYKESAIFYGFIIKKTRNFMRSTKYGQIWFLENKTLYILLALKTNNQSNQKNNAHFPQD